MLTQNTALYALPGVGPARGAKLEKLGLFTAGDLLNWFPRTYEDRRETVPIRNAPADRAVCVAAVVAAPPRLSRIRKGLELVKLRVVDGSAALELTFFNQAYVVRQLVPGEEYVFYGRVETEGNRRTMTNPVFESGERVGITRCIFPVYPLTAGISRGWMAALCRRTAKACAPYMPTALPAAIEAEYSLMALADAYCGVHAPESWEELGRARRRLVFEELFYLSAGLALLRTRRGGAVGRVLSSRGVEEFTALLPFTPTAAQKRVMAEVAADLAAGRPMNRLLQGDVGSGKTAVAAYAGWLAVRGGCQVALMAPTEILAAQHGRTLKALLTPAGIRVELLTASVKAAEKRRLLARLAAGDIDILVGTHALLSQGVTFRELGLVVADEQHRFGVEQRAALSAKAGEQGGMPPHVLIMSATPIPRTLALILYGDLEVSVLDQLPPGRTPVATFLVGESKRKRMEGFVRRQVQEGRQVYVVCPTVEERESAEGTEIPLGDLKAVTVYADRLRTKTFPDLRVGFVHGRLPAGEKARVMAEFGEGALDILVSTTVIEVGVDVPNAALMVIENAERFGLSQLHQLRGRVGRGEHPSYCILVSDTKNDDTRARLRTMTETADGFRIAEEDLKFRGPGDVLGSRQHGLPQLKAADLAKDLQVLREAQRAAVALLERDPHLSWPEHAPLLARVRDLFGEHPNIFN